MQNYKKIGTHKNIFLSFKKAPAQKRCAGAIKI
jgi:hypothetical protein